MEVNLLLLFIFISTIKKPDGDYNLSDGSNCKVHKENNFREFSVAKANGDIKAAVYSAFFENILSQIFLKIMLYDVKGKIIFCKDIASDEALRNVYKYEDLLIDERALGCMGYATPDDLDIVCCFEVIPLSMGQIVSFIDDADRSGDLELNCSDGNNIKVHRFVLAKQSAALKRSLSEMNKSENEKSKNLK